MTTALARSPFTADVLATLAELGFPVGDAEIPAGANWVGAPHTASAVFKPYLVVSEIVASRSWGPIGDWQADWQLPYLIESFGITREVTSKLADRARAKLITMRNRGYVIDGQDYGVQQVHLDSLGEPQRVASVNPPVWHTQDGITLSIGKGAP